MSSVNIPSNAAAQISNPTILSIYYVTTLVFHPSSGFMQISITGSTSILAKSKPPNNGISNFLKGTESLLCSKVCWTSGLLLLLPRLAENPVNRPFYSALLLSCSLIFFQISPKKTPRFCILWFFSLVSCASFFFLSKKISSNNQKSSSPFPSSLTYISPLKT